ncbi:hypothetical protein ACHAXN_003934 [Cyclotella atomus]
MKPKEERTHHHESSDSQPQCSNLLTSSLLPRILSGSIGSIVTALAVTPLEVVKIRQQLSGPDALSHHAHEIHHKTIEPCPRGCTVVFNNGLMECVVSKSSIFEGSFSRSFNTAQQAFLPRYNGGTLHTLSSILHYEGVAGLYAGLRPTLLMSVPNTVLYFTVYDEISLMMRRNHTQLLPSTTNAENENRIEEAKSQPYIPLIAGSIARLLASLATAPLELIRTRQASVVNDGAVPGMMQEFKHLLQTKGLSSLYVGLAPTLWRDVPFSAIYWMCLERFKCALSNSNALGTWGGRHYQEQNMKLPARVEAMHAFISGAAAGSIAAALTTPFDVVKTRRQMVVQEAQTGLKCNKSSADGCGPANLGIVGHLKQIVQQEGVSGLWKGNTTRMVKVAPACAIMISVYEFGKRAFGEVI